MYDELVKRLRDISNSDSNIKSNYIGLTMIQAADAIEELAFQNAKWEKAVKTCLDFIPCWVSVAERLPEDGQWVLVWGHVQHIPTMMFRESGAWIDDQFEFHSNITHWMPLPEPPKEEA